MAIRIGAMADSDLLASKLGGSNYGPARARPTSWKEVGPKRHTTWPITSCLGGPINRRSGVLGIALIASIAYLSLFDPSYRSLPSCRSSSKTGEGSDVYLPSWQAP